MGVEFDPHPYTGQKYQDGAGISKDRYEEVHMKHLASQSVPRISGAAGPNAKMVAGIVFISGG